MSATPPNPAELSPPAPAHAEQPPIPTPLPESWENPKEQAPMLDVHPAHHAASTWRDFFVHIATIVIGLLIAVGLEQTVEYFHHQQLGSPIYRPVPPTNTIRLGNFSAAKASGLVQLLSEDEINIVSDAEVGVSKSEALKELAQEATRKRAAFEQRFQMSYPEGAFDFAAATPVQLNEYLGLLIEERVRRVEYLAYLDEMHGGATAFLKGQRDIQKIRHAEEDSLSPSPH